MQMRRLDRLPEQQASGARLRAAASLDGVSGTAMARSELEMSLNRFVFCLVTGIYMTAVRSPNLHVGLLYIVGYFAFSGLLFLHIRRYPEANRVRAAVALVGDFSMISFEMHVGGAPTSAFYPLYLWVILGNGFRFGLRFLFIAMAAALLGFGLVCLTTPFWLNQRYISGGLFVGLIIVPAYGGTLIRKLSAARLQAEAGNRAKSMFLASVSHSVRTPLNAIVGSAALLRDTPLDSEQNELVHKLHIGADILTSLLTGILDFMQIEAEQMPVRNAPVDVGSILADLRTLMAPQARAKGLRIFIHIASDVPAKVLTDARHLHEILLNLISNALKFTDSGGITVSVGAGRAASGRTVLTFDIMDTGIGIEADAIGRIFDSFTQADSTILDRFGGTGLGLAIVKRLVLLLGGTIGVTSTVGEGSVFSFSLECETPPIEALPVSRLLSSGRQRIVFFSLGKRTGLPPPLAALSIPTDVATTPTELAALLRNPGTNGAPRPILILEGSSPTANFDVIVPLLTMLDHAGDIPRLLIIDGMLAGEALQLRRHITTSVGQDCTSQDLLAALRICTLMTGASPDVEEVLPVPGRRLQILVAEDNATNQRLVTKILERAGHDVHVVQNGEDAVVALVDRHFDLALLDVNMPVMSGLEAAEEYRVLSMGDKPVPIVALTADATPDMARRCLEAGMVDCITKPVTPTALIARIEQLLPHLAAPRSRPDIQAPAATVSSIDSHPYFRAALPALDRQVVADLHALGGSDFASEMLNGFVKDAEDVIGHLLEAAEGNDLLTYRSEAHALRSAAANVGARIIHDMCGQCRDVLPAELTTRGLRLAQRFQIELARVRTAVPRHDDRAGLPLIGGGD